MAKRRANGEGSIRHRESDGRWEGRYTAGYDPDTGKRIVKSVFGKTFVRKVFFILFATEVAASAPTGRFCKNSSIASFDL